MKADNAGPLISFQGSSAIDYIKQQPSYLWYCWICNHHNVYIHRCYHCILWYIIQ